MHLHEDEDILPSLGLDLACLWFKGTKALIRSLRRAAIMHARD